MSQSRVTYRYAKALLLLSVEKNMLQGIYSDMCFVERVCVENKELTLLLKSPIIKTDKKQKILHEVFGSKITEVSMRFVQIITNKKREHLLEDIARAFLVQYKQHNNIEEVVVTTATPLTNELKESIVSYIKRDAQKDVDLVENIDQKIIGGVIVRVGDKQLDASVSSEIKELRKIFNKNLYLQDF